MFKKYKVGDSPYAPQIETTKGGGEYVKNDNGTYSKKYPYAGQTGRFPQLGYQKDFNDTYYSPIGDNVNDEPYERTSYNDFKLHKDRHNDMSNYFKGNSKYVKGQGWQ